MFFKIVQKFAKYLDHTCNKIYHQGCQKNLNQVTLQLTHSLTHCQLFFCPNKPDVGITCYLYLNLLNCSPSLSLSHCFSFDLAFLSHISVPLLSLYLSLSTTTPPSTQISLYIFHYLYLSVSLYTFINLVFYLLPILPSFQYLSLSHYFFSLSLYTHITLSLSQSFVNCCRL